MELIAFEGRYKDKVIHLIHDNDPTFVYINYVGYSIKNIKTSIKAPDMNVITERFVRSIRNEALDNFILLNHKQISNIISEYIQYYNSMRPHQGANSIPQGKPPDSIEPDYSVHNIKAKPVLGGFRSLSGAEGHHHYYREAS